MSLKAREAYAAGGLGPFDAIASFSSVEHSGLGRYSDAFNPWGDLQVRCLVEASRW